MKPKVAFISQPEYFRFSYEHDLDEAAYVREFKLNYSMGKDEFGALTLFDADFNVFFRGEFAPAEVLKRLRGVKIALSSEPFPRMVNGKWDQTIDSIGRYCAFREIRTMPFDYVFHYDQASLPVFERDGLHLSGVFPFPVATRTYTYRDRPKNWDLFFIGRSTRRREAYFGSLKHYRNFLHICHGIWGPELNEFVNASKICLNIHAESEVSWEPRVQMMLAAGAFVISERISPNSYLRPGVDYIEIGNPKEAFNAVTYYLDHEGERNKIAVSGYQRVREVLDSRTNYMTLFDQIGKGRYPKFRHEDGCLKYNLYGRGLRALHRLRWGINRFHG